MIDLVMSFYTETKGWRLTGAVGNQGAIQVTIFTLKQEHNSASINTSNGHLTQGFFRVHQLEMSSINNWG